MRDASSLTLFGSNFRDFRCLSARQSFEVRTTVGLGSGIEYGYPWPRLQTLPGFKGIFKKDRLYGTIMKDGVETYPVVD